jgi:hypothetical protein
MHKILGMTGAAIVALSLAGWAVGARGQQDPPPEGAAAKAGEKLDDLGRALRRSLVDAEDSLRQGLNRTGE